MSSRSLRRVAAVAFAALLARGAAGDDETERPFAGVLPAPQRGVSVNPPETDAEAPTVAATYVFDATSGRRIAGATLARWAEDESAGVLSYAKKLGEGVSDTDGLACVAVPHLLVQAHWTVEAPGHAPAYAFGPRAPEFVALPRGADVKARLLDPTGKPVADAAIDVFLGCEHSATTRTARTAKDGTFVVPSIAPTPFSLCATTPAGACRRVAGVGGLGRRTSDVVLETGFAARGRFLSADGAPLAGVVLRGTDFERAPIATTGADGRFEIAGLTLGSALRVLVPGATKDDVAGHACGPLPVVVRLDADGRVATPDCDAKPTLRVRTGDGMSADGESVRLTRVADGWTTTIAAGAQDCVPAGAYDVAPATPFERGLFAPFRWEVPAGVPAERAVAAALQPKLVVESARGPFARVVLSVKGGDLLCRDDLAKWRPSLPAEAPATLMVQPTENEAVAFFFAVGPVKDGVRTVRADVPPPHRVSVAGAAKWDAVRLTCDGVPVAFEAAESRVLTYADGPMVLDARVDGAPRRFEFELSGGVRDVVLDAKRGAELPAQETVRVGFFRPGGAPAKDLEFRFESPSEGGSATADDVVEAPTPCRLTVRCAGLQTFDRWIAAPGELKFAWGPCALHLAVRDDAGAPVPSIVQVDGVLHWTAAGALELAGLDAGPHRVVVSPVREGLVGRELSLVLADGETRTREVKLAKR